MIPWGCVRSVFLATRRPVSRNGCAMQRGRLPPPSPRNCASSLACMLATVKTSWPLSSPKVRARPRCTVSATATARCCWMRASLSGSGAWASGWWGATQYTKLTCPRGLVWMPGWLVPSGVIPMARSAWPEVSTSIVPERVSSRRRMRVGGASAKKASHNSITVALAMMVSMAMVNCDSHPVATRRTRLATASISASRRSPSRSSSRPASVRRAWRALRSNKRTSSASSIWRTR